jgi:CDGSH-type Zn-finger protein/ferredoxin
MDTLTIEPKPDGPLLVSGPIELRNSRGETVAVQSQYWLCRCGGSNSKPFCDGTHKKNGFSSAREANTAPRAAEVYVGNSLEIHDDRSVCAHAGHCTAHSPKVFSMTTRPWIDPDADAVEATMATIRSCPSGALAYSVDGVLHEHSGRTPAIGITRNGPYAVAGAASLLGDAPPISAEHYTLCRCGQSKNKPFCDGAHWNAGFNDEKN